MGYSKEDIHRIDDEHTDREDEAKFMCDEPDHDEGEDE